MDVATWNVNSLRARAERVEAWLDRSAPDVVCLQETKVTDDQFPSQLFEDRGYDVRCFGQPTYNGVCIAAKRPLEIADVRLGLPGDGADAQRRTITATVGGFRIVNVYVPNGSEVGSEKYDYKLSWLPRLQALLHEELEGGLPLVCLGDFNVAPGDADVWDPDAYRGSIMFSDAEFAALQSVLDTGLVDLLRHFTDEPGLYTWWDYRRLGFPKNRGWRIDLVLTDGGATERARGVTIDRDERKGKQPSDHVPVIATFA